MRPLLLGGMHLPLRFSAAALPLAWMHYHSHSSGRWRGDGLWQGDGRWQGGCHRQCC